MSLKVEAAVWGLMRDPCFTKRSRNVYFRSVTLRGSGLAAFGMLGCNELSSMQRACAGRACADVLLSHLRAAHPKCKASELKVSLHKIIPFYFPLGFIVAHLSKPVKTQIIGRQLRNRNKLE